MTMRIALNIGGHQHNLDDIRAAARDAAEDGLAGAWMSQIFGPDALTALAVVGKDVPYLELGVSVVPIYGRHPLALALQARTVQAAVDGRLTLGIGPSHQFVVEVLYGDSYARPCTRTKEYLQALLPLLAGEPADVAGQEITARGKLDIDAPAAPPVLVAGLGPKMLHLAGTEAAGTTLWMVGPDTIAKHITPTITAAATEAGRPSPRILAGVTACVTDDPDAVRTRSATEQGLYASLPAYQHMMQAEGVEGPADLVIAGDEETVARGIQRYADAGATDVRVTILSGTTAERNRTRAVLRSLGS
jgi:F420-dependent oxidoreductase-like protein